jgi:hypothetical protein
MAFDQALSAKLEISLAYNKKDGLRENVSVGRQRVISREFTVRIKSLEAAV